jgi:hypothetical protein
VLPGIRISARLRFADDDPFPPPDTTKNKILLAKGLVANAAVFRRIQTR